MNWYEAIYIRKSVRRYSKKAVPPVLLAHIENCAEKLNYVWQDAACTIKIYNAKEAQRKIKGVFRVSAPYYMAIFAKKTPASLVEAGCFAQRLVLYMTTKGLGSCYQGGCFLSKSEIPDDKQLAIIIAFGYAQGKTIRDPKYAKRYPLNKICHFRGNAGEEIRTMLKAARLAPSALNEQPWRFEVWSDRIEIYQHNSGLLKKFFSSSQLLDIGIALCHMIEAADDQWLSVEAVREEERLESEKKQNGKENGKKNGDRYIITVRKCAS